VKECSASCIAISQAKKYCECQEIKNSNLKELSNERKTCSGHCQGNLRQVHTHVNSDDFYFLNLCKRNNSQTVRTSSEIRHGHTQILRIGIEGMEFTTVFRQHSPAFRDALLICNTRSTSRIVATQSNSCGASHT